MKKMRKKLFAVVVMLCMFLQLMPWSALAAPLEDGDGTSGNPYEINDVDDLIAFRDLVNSGDTDACAVLTANIDLSSKYGADIDGAEVSWEPIGDGTKQFKGTFDGGNFTISGLYINGTNMYQGLFGYLGQGGTIQNLSVSGTVNGYFFVAGVVGTNDGGSISNCINHCTVTGSSFVGGIVGQNTGSSNFVATVKDCSNYGAITCTNPVASAGGIVGSNSDLNTLVKDCKNYGSISGGSGSTFGYTGGIVGQNYGTVTGCINEKEAHISGGEAYSIGGIVGYNFCEIANCYNLGETTMTDDATTAYIGGIAGLSYLPPTPFDGTCKIENCYSYTDSAVPYSAEGSTTNCYYLSDRETEEVNGVTGKTSAQFASGEVAYLLQSGQAEDGGVIPQVWGQMLTGETPDMMPVFTSDNAKKVLKVSFMLEDEQGGTYIEHAAAYANPEGTVTLPEEPISSVYDFIKWSMTNSADGTEFTAQTLVTKDIAVYAIGQEMYGETDHEKTITITYGAGATQDLSDYMTYAGNTDAAEKFTYEITNRTAVNGNTINASISGDTLTIPADTNADTYTLTIQATEKASVIAPFSVDYDTQPVTITITVVVNKAKPTIVTEPEASRVRRGRLLSTSDLAGGVVNGLEGLPLEGTWTWQNDREMTETGTFNETAVFTPTNTNYESVEVVNIPVTVYRSSSGGGSSTTTYYTVTFDTQGGSVIDSVRVAKNATASEPKEPSRDGYTFAGWFTNKEYTTAYDFDSKVTENITLYAKWTEEVVEPGDPTDPSGWDNPFTDVAEDDWFYDAVRYVETNDLFSGITDTTFAPNEAITRGMMVTVLWRNEGKPAVDYRMTFEDVAPAAYYAEAVRWAASEGIVKGYSDAEYAPNKLISREEMAAIMNRYADYKGIDTSITGDLTKFADQAQIANWARENIAWAVGSGLISGRDNGMLDPQGNTTRAEAATILQRFLTK